MEEKVLVAEHYLLNEKLQLLLKKELVNGVPNPLWIRNEALIKRFIEKNMDMLEKYEQPEISKSRVTKPINNDLLHIEFDDPRWWRGGIRVAHLHLKDQTFILNDKQWDDFSYQLMNTLREKLSASQTVNFQQAMELSEAIFTM